MSKLKGLVDKPVSKISEFKSGLGDKPVWIAIAICVLVAILFFAFGVKNIKPFLVLFVIAVPVILLIWGARNHPIQTLLFLILCLALVLAILGISQGNAASPEVVMAADNVADTSISPPEESTQPPAESTKKEEPKEEAEEECSLNNLSEGLQPWCELIESTSDRYDIEPSLIAAMVTQESGGQPEVISSSGAVGLMQVMPRDGIAASFQCINGPCFANRPSTEELMSPEFNLDYGVRMIAGLIDRYDDVREALVAYGPMNVGYYYADKVLAIQDNLEN